MPNVFFEELLADLSGSALKVYCKIVRNTLGWRNQHGEVKTRDWIAHSQFEKATGLSNRSVTSGINELLEKKLIRVTDEKRNDLTNPSERKYAKRIYYALNLFLHEKTTNYNAQNDKRQTQELRTTKETFLQKYPANKRMPDHVRIQQIFDEQQRMQNKRDEWL